MSLKSEETNSTEPESEIKTWAPSTKMIVGISFVSVVAFLLVRFNNVIGPLIFAFIIAYILRPVANFIAVRFHISWKLAVNLLYIIFLISFIGFFAVTGVALVGEIQDLVVNLSNFADNLPTMIQELTVSDQVINIPVVGPIVVGEFISGFNFDLQAVIEQIVGVVQPLLGQAGSLVGTVASSAISFIGWMFFILSTSYFLLSESGKVPDTLKNADLPTQTEELKRLGRELNRVWNAYLRGQLLVSFTVGTSYTVILLIFGVNNALALGLMAGLSRFVPYIGQWVTNSTVAITAFLQVGNYFGLEPGIYALLVFGIIFVVDQFVDGFVIPKIFSSALGIHPAALLVTAIIAASLIGFLGLILAAPVLATTQLIVRYITRKMVDLDPWPEPEAEPESFSKALFAGPINLWQRIRTKLKRGNK